MHDDPIIVRLRTGLDALTAAVDDTPPPLHRDVPLRPAGVGDRHGGDRRRAWLAVAAAALLATGTAGVWLAGRTDPGTDATEEPPNPTSGQTPPVPFVPDGWEIVEYGSVRFAVPKAWGIFEGACTTRLAADTATFHVECGERSDNGDIVDPVTISITDREFTADESVDLGELNGFATVDIGGDGCDGCVSYRGIPALGVEVGIGVPSGETALAAQLWAAVTASGRWRGQHLPAPSVPDDWVELEYEGLAVSVPPDWVVRELGDGEPGAETCSTGFARPEVVTGTDELYVTMRCPASAEIGLRRPADGLRIVPTPSVNVLELAPGWSVVTRQLARSSGYPTEMVVYAGIGEDPAVGATILHSVRPACAPDCPPSGG